MSRVNAFEGYLLGLFHVNVLHSLVHVLFGILGITMSRSFNTVFGLIPIHGHDVWLHGITAASAAYFGWRSEVPHAERRGSRLDRRHRMHPVAQERRHGVADRRFAHSRMMAGV